MKNSSTVQNRILRKPRSLLAVTYAHFLMHAEGFVLLARQPCFNQVKQSTTTAQNLIYLQAVICLPWKNL